MLVAKGKPGDIINIGSGNEVPNIQVAKFILERLGKPESLISFVPDRPGHDFRCFLDWEKIREIGWRPEVSLQFGLQRTIDWCVQNKRWWEPIAQYS